MLITVTAVTIAQKKHKNNPQGDLGALRIISILIIIH